MAHPLYWPGKYFFYPIGNTSAVSLTRDIPPEHSPNILLLGCGDPRNVLYTIFSEPQIPVRTLDFTCCDMDPGILARNVLLLSMVADKQPDTSVLWNIFFHMYLDKNSHTALVEHCTKLIALSESLQTWNASPYALFLKMSTEHTLAELRRHWSLYAAMHDLPRARIKAVRDAFDSVKSSTPVRKAGTLVSPARSLGPLMMKGVDVASNQCKNYWKTGVTFSNPKQIAAATLVNPTFAYSLAGEGCAVHYGTDPIVPFHLAALFGNAKASVSISDMVTAAKAEFSDWCSSYHAAVSPPSPNVPVVRFFLGEVTAVCRALRSFATTGTLSLGVPIAQWKTTLIHLNRDEYVTGGAPATFDVIETSNLNDHLGLLNVLIAAVPLLAPSAPSSVLYTESLLFHGQDATKEFTEHLHADITTIGLLFGLCPVDYIAGFTTRSNTHELFMNMAAKTPAKTQTTQFHQVTTWKLPASADPIALSEHRPPVFDPHQLGTLIYDMYHDLFEQEDAKHFWRLNQGNMAKAISSSNLIHYMRESFVLFLKFIRVRLCLSSEHWRTVMDRFFDLEDADQSLPMDSVNYQDLCAHLHRQGVYTVTHYHTTPSKIGLFAHWDAVPTLVRIVLTVPRAKLAVLEDSGTPPLQCDVRGSWSQNIFTAVHVAFGHAIPMGTPAHPWVSFEEDPEGWAGTAPLVASFTMPTHLLTDIEPMECLNVCFSVRSCPGTVVLIGKLGIRLNIFSAPLLDRAHVLVVPEQPLPLRTLPVPAPVPASPCLLAQIGESSAAVVALDQECELVESLTCRVLVQDKEAKAAFGADSVPAVEQVSPCVMRVSIGVRAQDLVYPFPVIGSQSKLRFARKSLYIEVVVPISGPFKLDGMKLNPFPVVRTRGVLSPWSVHRLNLSRMPVLNATVKAAEPWLNAHVGSMMSARERSLRKKHKPDALMFVKDTLHTIFVRASGVQGGPARRVFALRDAPTNNCDTLIFVGALRFDLAAHTLVCDAYVLPLTYALMRRVEHEFARLAQRGNMVSVNAPAGEMRAWKQLLPALAERCRSWTHGAQCEYAASGEVPLTVAMEADPLCSCGRGQDTAGMAGDALWEPFAPHATRVALGPLFAVSYLEKVGRDPEAHRCIVCRGRGKPKLMTCTVCVAVRYCSRACQKRDWKMHKLRCKRRNH